MWGAVKEKKPQYIQYNANTAQESKGDNRSQKTEKFQVLFKTVNLNVMLKSELSIGDGLCHV
jgi:hypothetical protein